MEKHIFKDRWLSYIFLRIEFFLAKFRILKGLSFFPFSALTVQFEPADYLVTEGEQVAILVVLSDSADREVTVQFTTVDDSATGNYACSSE